MSNTHAVRVTGKVKFFNESKGYGFIKPDNGMDDVFVHKTALGRGVQIDKDDRVSFQVVDDKKGKKAADVRILN